MMLDMRRRLPSIRALESFEAVHRFGNVTRAAEELGRTQSAVSRQIAILEEFVGHALFTRGRKQLVLNRAGSIFYEKIAFALDSLEEAISDQINTLVDERVLKLGVLPSFASKWLMPRLKPLFEKNPPIELYLAKGLGRSDFDALDVDAAIVCEHRTPTGIASHHLLNEEVVAVIAPDLYSSGSKVFNKLYMPARSHVWEVWSQERNPVPSQSKIRFENYSMMIEATCLGFGVSIVPAIYVQHELDSGQLIAPFGKPLTSGRGYWLIYPETTANQSKIIDLLTLLDKADELQLSLRHDTN